MRNQAGQPIRHAEITTTSGERVDVTKAGPIASAEGRNVAVPGKSCIASVDVTLQNGKELKLTNQNQCSLSQIEVHADRMDLASSAVVPMPSKQ